MSFSSLGIFSKPVPIPAPEWWDNSDDGDDDE